ncbi:MAG: PfkB family carbohydrate kinase [Chloroflexota bacterium]
MADLQIVGLGMAVLDVLIRLREMPSWERGGGFSALRLDGGGPVGTAMVAAARLGARVGFVGTAGNDQLAELKLASFVQDGVDLSRLVRRDRPEDQVVLVYVDEQTGERVFAGLRGLERRPLLPEELDRDYITSAEFLHLEGFHTQAALQAAQWMRAAGKRVCLDGSRTDGRPLQPHMTELVHHVDILICGTGFGRSLTGRADLWEAGEAILGLGPQIVVQTEGKDGSYTTTASERFHLPAFDVQVVDTTGAGDVFHGAYLVGLLHGWDLRSVGLFATAVSALKCAQLGGRRGIPRFNDVIAFLEAHSIHLPQGA